ncbi:MAG: lysophospholipid acyltransferase family protein [Bdellovibrionota bacterium]
MIRQLKNSLEITARMAKFFAEASLKSVKIQDPVELRRYLIQHVSDGCKPAIESLNFDVKLVGFDAARMKSNNYLMVGNHMSYMDVLVLASAQPALFVTSEDMGELPVLGHITKMAGCIFVERRNRSKVDRDLHQMTEALKQGFDVMIYPEGTSTNGQQVLPFKKSLLMAAVEAGKDIQPICLKYTEIDGEPFGPHNADKICWYGDMTFAPHFLQVMNLKSVKAELHFLDPIKVTKDSTRSELAEQAYRSINDEYMKGRDPIAAQSVATPKSAASSQDDVRFA